MLNGSHNALATLDQLGDGPGGVDVKAAEGAARGLLVALGADLGSEHLRETPRRVAKACAGLLSPRPFNATTFPNGVRSTTSK